MKITFSVEAEDGNTTLSLECSEDNMSFANQVKLFKNWVDAQGYVLSRYNRWLLEQLQREYMTDDEEEQIMKMVKGK